MKTSITATLGIVLLAIGGAPRAEAQSPAAQFVLIRIDATVPGGRAGISTASQWWINGAAMAMNSARFGGMFRSQAECVSVAREVVEQSGAAAGFSPSNPQIAQANAQWAAGLAGGTCPPDGGAPGPAPAPTPAPSSDVDAARGHITWAMGAGGCTRLPRCMTWVRFVPAFGVRVAVTRQLVPAGDMIIRAKAARMVGQDELARALVAGTQIHNDGVQNWLDAHPAAVLTVLDQLSFDQLRGAADALTLLRSIFPLLPIP